MDWPANVVAAKPAASVASAPTTTARRSPGAKVAAGISNRIRHGGLLGARSVPGKSRPERVRRLRSGSGPADPRALPRHQRPADVPARLVPVEAHDTAALELEHPLVSVSYDERAHEPLHEWQVADQHMVRAGIERRGDRIDVVLGRQAITFRHPLLRGEQRLDAQYTR